MKKAIYSLVILLAMSTAALAQCKSLVKKNMTKLAPYTHNGQLNSANLKKGGALKIQISCYTGMGYRLAVCGDDALGKLVFRVLDETGHEVFNSATNNNVSSWDFNVGTSQELTVEITAPNANAAANGCAALLVGFREPTSAAGRPM